MLSYDFCLFLLKQNAILSTFLCIVRYLPYFCKKCVKKRLFFKRKRLFFNLLIQNCRKKVLGRISFKRFDTMQYLPFLIQAASLRRRHVVLLHFINSQQELYRLHRSKNCKKYPFVTSCIIKYENSRCLTAFFYVF